MNIIELEQKLKELAVPPDAYSLHGGLPNNHIAYPNLMIYGKFIIVKEG